MPSSIWASTEEVVLLDHYRLGDQIYNLCLAAAIQTQVPRAKLRFVSSPVNACSPLPSLFGIETAKIQAPWLRSGWVSRLHELSASRLEFSQVIDSTSEATVCIDPRGGLTGRFLLAGNRRLHTFNYQPRGALSWRQRLLGYSKNHIFHDRLNLLEQLGLDPSALRWPFMEKLFRTKPIRGLVALVPGASTPGKEWPHQHWLAIQDALAASGFDTVAVLPPQQVSGQRSYDLLSNPWRGSIFELGELLVNCSAVIAVDSFGGHFASAIGTPVLSLFGVTDPAFWRPWGASNIQLRPSRAQTLQFTRRCIETEGPRLMAEITPSDVLTCFKSWRANRPTS